MRELISLFWASKTMSVTVFRFLRNCKTLRFIDEHSKKEPFPTDRFLAFMLTTRHCRSLRVIQLSDSKPEITYSLHTWLIKMISLNKSTLLQIADANGGDRVLRTPRVVKALLQCPNLTSLDVEDDLEATETDKLEMALDLCKTTPLPLPKLTSLRLSCELMMGGQFLASTLQGTLCLVLLA